MQPPLPHPTPPPAPVTCLGQTFDSDDARRAHFTELLRQKLQDPAFRAIEGFPIGTDEAILALSDPPYYTACPNPWLGEIVAEWQAARRPTADGRPLPEGTTDDGRQTTADDAPFVGGQRSAVGRHSSAYHREPFAADVSEGKNDPIYNAHSYHTKVPHKAIMRYILHYTAPGDIVFDGFCGTGMTGVAAQLCGDRRAVEGLGYRVDGDGVVWDGARAISRLGARRAVLNDLSPAATFIAYNYNTPVDTAAFEREARRILDEVKNTYGWMFSTSIDGTDQVGEVKARIWSSVFICPNCSAEVVFFDEAVDIDTGSVESVFHCSACGAELRRRGLEHALEHYFDARLGTMLLRPKRVPVLVEYIAKRSVSRKRLNQEDFAVVERIQQLAVNVDDNTPAIPLLLREGDWGDLQRGYHQGITHTHHFYFDSTLHILSAFNQALYTSVQKRMLKLLFTSQLINLSKMNRYRPNVSFPYNPLSGTLYVGSQISEANPFIAYKNKINRLVEAKQQTQVETGSVVLVTQSTTEKIPGMGPESADYIFVDPPFGDNLPYSELSFLWESWLGVITNTTQEAIISKVQQKGLLDYTGLLRASFATMYLYLKPGRWITVEFHNSRNSVWNAIQEALMSAGFVIADVRVLDKQTRTKKQISGDNAVKQDLVISAYKPNDGLEQRFLSHAGTAEGAWDFARHHLGQLPVAVETEAGLEPVAERHDYLLFDRMVAFHIQRGAAVPLSAAEFYAGLRRRFDERDGMFFLKEQVPAYNAARLRAGRPAQLALFVSDEKSSLQWLRQQLDPALGGRPQTYQELQPAFLRNLHQAAHEALPELRDLLADSFLPDDDGRWHAPDPNRAEDLERLRRRALLAEFETYLSGRGKIKQFRSEAVRAGFADAYRRKEFGLILRVAERLPERVVQEDPELLMYYDAASLRGN